MAISNTWFTEPGSTVITSHDAIGSMQVLPRTPNRNLVPEHLLTKPGSPLALTLAEIHAMWHTRYQDQWVSSQEIADDSFWHFTAQRLAAAGQMECLPVLSAGGRTHEVYRIRGDDADR